MCIVVHVHNGVVQTVWAGLQNADVSIVATDSDDSAEDEAKDYKRLEELTANLTAVY